jgi:hypothetical protein
MASLDELDELVDDGARLADLLVGAVDRDAVAAQEDLAAESIAQRAEDAVVHGRELGRDLIRDGQDLLQLFEL